MSNKLEIIFQLKDHPYPEDSMAIQEVWGGIALNINNQLTNFHTQLFAIEWDVLSFSEWFVDNWASIWDQSLPNFEGKNLSSESIAQQMIRCQQIEFDPNEQESEDAWFDMLYDFRQKHCLWFALRGTDTPEIFIGFNRGNGEISLASEQHSWCYDFDMNVFREDFREYLQEILNRCLDASSMQRKIRIRKILSNIKRVMT